MSPLGLDALRNEFALRHCVRLPGILDSSLLAWLLREVDRAEFHERVHQGIGSNRELCMRDNTVAGVLHVLFNGAALFRLVRDITGCGPIGNFGGRVYRMAPRQGHHDAWHSDVGDHRMIGMSVNLGAEVFAGGMLQIRERDTQRLLCEVANTGPGDALVFRLGPELQHRVTEVAGEFPKTAFAGWFRSTPRAREWLGIERSSTEG